MCVWVIVNTVYSNLLFIFEYKLDGRVRLGKYTLKCVRFTKVYVMEYSFLYDNKRKIFNLLTLQYSVK